MFLFLLQTIAISLTGVMAPGPITAVTIGAGVKSPHSGASIAVGHGIVEFPLMILIYFGLGKFLHITGVKGAIFVMGGVFLLYLGFDILRGLHKISGMEVRNVKNPLAAGIMLTAGNAYFLIWWATAGATLLAGAAMFGLAGVLLFALTHWTCDFVWLYFLSAASYKGENLFGMKFQKTILAVCGVFLLFFGGKFLFDAVSIMRG